MALIFQIKNKIQRDDNRFNRGMRTDSTFQPLKQNNRKQFLKLVKNHFLFFQIYETAIYSPMLNCKGVSDGEEVGVIPFLNKFQLSFHSLLCIYVFYSGFN